jgi:hypothetical protein
MSATETKGTALITGASAGIGTIYADRLGDILRIEDGLLAEHWDVIQDEATRGSSTSGLPIFGDKFPA